MTTETVSATDLLAQLTALRLPCPSCGTHLVGARCHGRPEGEMQPHAFLGLVCPNCEAVFSLGNGAQQ